MPARRHNGGRVSTVSPAPAYFSIPPYVKTFGPEVSDFCAEANFAPDEHQRQGLDAIFARRATGRSAAFEFCVVVGRQNLKSGLFKQAELGWLFLFDERLVVYSAHEFGTAMEMFRDMEEIVTGSDFLRKQVKAITRSHGEEAIELKTGARLIFRTRTKGGGRGLSGRKVILDEGWGLRPFHMGALLPTLSAQPDPQVLYASSAGLEQSDVLRGVRDRGRAGAEETLAYVEYCAPPPEIACEAGRSCTHSLNAIGCGCDNPDYWIMANPAVGIRISLDYIRAERRALPVGEFIRERMGWWDEPTDSVSPIKLEEWYRRADRDSRIAQGSPLALGIDVAQDKSMSAISIAGWRSLDPEDDTVHGELVEHLPGTGWVIPRLMAIAERRNPCAVALDPVSPAGAFEKELRNRGFVVRPKEPDKPFRLGPGQRLLMLIGITEYVQGCGEITNDIANDTLRHPDQAPLNGAVEGSRKREVGRAWVWDAAAGADITPLVSLTHARHALATYGHREPPKPFVLT